TFSEAWRALPGFAGRSSVSSWLHGIAYHIYIDWRRAQRPTEYRPDEWWHSQPSFAQRPDELAATSDLRSVLYKSVETLDEELRAQINRGKTSGRASSNGVTNLRESWLRRWWLILTPAAVSLFCAMVLAVQHFEIRDLQETLKALLPPENTEPASQVARQAT